MSSYEFYKQIRKNAQNQFADLSQDEKLVMINNIAKDFIKDEKWNSIEVGYGETD